MHGYLITFIELLLVATLVGMISQRVRIPYSTGLVITGAMLGLFNLVPTVHMDPDVIFQVMLPILVFGAALETDATHLKQNIRPVALLSSVGMVAMAGMTGGLLKVVLDLSWAQALLLGTMLSITDTVSVLAIFKNVRVPDRLAILIEGESLLNDGTALVLFQIILAVAVGGAFSLQQSASSFVLVSLGGIAIGTGLGYLASMAIQQTRDHLIEIFLTTAVALGAYTLAESLHTSGVMAAVIAGLVVGNYGWRRSLSPSSQVALGSFWEYAAFGVNSAIFLLLGMNVDMALLFAHLPVVILALLAVHGGRMLLIYGGNLLARSFTPDVLPVKWQHVLVWGNVKGSLTMALALGLPAAVPDRDLLTAIIFGVVFFSLVTQGLTLGPLLRWLRVQVDPGVRQFFEEEKVRLIGARAAQEELVRMQRAGVLSTSTFERLKARYQVVIARAEKRLRQLGSQHPEQWDQAMLEMKRRLITVEKSAVLQARREKLIADDVCDRYIEDLDAASVAAAPIHRRANEADPAMQG